MAVGHRPVSIREYRRPAGHHGKTLKVFDLSENFVEFSSEIIFSYSITAVGCFCLFLSHFLGPRGHQNVRQNAGAWPAIRPGASRRNSRAFESKANRFLTFLLSNQLTSFQLFSLFTSLFFWQSLLFLTNNIKTNAVVVGKRCLLA